MATKVSGDYEDFKKALDKINPDATTHYKKKSCATCSSASSRAPRRPSSTRRSPRTTAPTSRPSWPGGPCPCTERTFERRRRARPGRVMHWRCARRGGGRRACSAWSLRCCDGGRLRGASGAHGCKLVRAIAPCSVASTASVRRGGALVVAVQV